MTSGEVLLVDDEPDIVELCRINLEIAGFSVRSVSRGALVVDAVAERRPDVIVLDLRMPGGDGWSVLDRLRSDSASADIPVILLSADGGAAEVLDCWEPGLLELVEKPFVPSTLVEAVRRAGSSEADREAHAATVRARLALG